MRLGYVIGRVTLTLALLLTGCAGPRMGQSFRDLRYPVATQLLDVEGVQVAYSDSGGAQDAPALLLKARMLADQQKVPEARALLDQVLHLAQVALQLVDLRLDLVALLLDGAEAVVRGAVGDRRVGAVRPAPRRRAALRSSSAQATGRASRRTAGR